MSRYVLGLDNGGTMTKAALFTLEGKEVFTASCRTPVYAPRPGYCQRDMEELWQANCSCIRQVLAGSGAAPEEILGLAVCGHGKGLYLWGKDDAPAYSGIGSTDNRARKIVERWYAEGSFERLYPRLCQQLLPCQQAALLRWMKEEEPAVYANIRYVFSVKDYIRFRLTGEARSELTDISGSGLLNVRGACFDPELLETLGIGECMEALAPLCSTADLCGTVTEAAAAATGLSVGTPVAGGMFDVDACAIAAGVTHPGQVCAITGTWSINEVISTDIVEHPAAPNHSVYAIPGYYLLEESSATGAGNLEWVIANCMDTGGRSGGELYDWLAEQCASVDPADSSVYYLPYIYGSNAAPGAKACFLGMTEYHRAAHMARAVFEGVVFSHKRHLDRLAAAVPGFSALRLAGGAVNSPFWVQMFADVLGCTVETVEGVRELGALGCAMAAAVAAGIYPDYGSAAEHMVHIGHPVQPDMEKHRLYEKKYENYRLLSDALDTVWARLDGGEK